MVLNRHWRLLSVLCKDAYSVCRAAVPHVDI